MKPISILNRIEPTVSGPRNVDIYEHKAPTDESLKLLKEMQEEALQSIIWHESNEGIKNNTFNYSFDIIACAGKDSMLYRDNKLIIFSAMVNGKKYQVKRYLSELGERFEIIRNKMKNSQRWSEISDEEIGRIRLFMLSKLIAAVIVDSDNADRLFTELIH